MQCDPSSKKLALLTALMWLEISGCESWSIGAVAQGAWPLQIAQMLDSVGVPVTAAAMAL